MEAKTLFENSEVKIKATGRDYDFIATVENKTDHPVVVAPSENVEIEEQFTPFIVEPGDWTGVQADYEGGCFMKAVDTNSIDIAGPERFEDIDHQFDTMFANDYAARVDMER